MKNASALFFAFLILFSTTAYGQENTADSLIFQTEEALLHRDYAKALEFLEEASGKVKLQTNAIYKYEILLRIANLQATNENLWRILTSNNLNKDFVDRSIREIEQHLRQFAELIEIAGTSGNPLEPKTLPHEMAAVNKILEAMDTIGFGRWARAPGLAFDADIEIGKAISALTGTKVIPKAVPPSAPSKPGEKDISKNPSRPGAPSAPGLFFYPNPSPGGIC